MAALPLDDQADEIEEAQRQTGSSVVEKELSLVGCFLTASVIHFPTMRSTLANLWHPVRGIEILILVKKGICSDFFTGWIWSR